MSSQVLPSLPCGRGSVARPSTMYTVWMLLAVLVALLESSSARPPLDRVDPYDYRPYDADVERDWLFRDGDGWVAVAASEELDSVLPHPQTTSAASTGDVRRYSAQCGACNKTACAVKAPEKCKGTLGFDECGCCRVCVKQDGQRCQSKRRPCKIDAMDLQCLVDEGGVVNRCQTIEGNCTSGAKGGIYTKNFPQCRRCHCNGDGKELCRPLNCQPSPSPHVPATCKRQRCLEHVMPGQCCKVFSHCRCTDEPPVLQTQRPRHVSTLHPPPSRPVVLAPVCSLPSSCPSNRTSGKNVSSVRYIYSRQQSRCIMFWQRAGCTSDTNFASLEACRRQCVEPQHLPPFGNKSSSPASVVSSGRCLVGTRANEATCSSMRVPSRRALYKAVVRHMENVLKGVLYKVEIKHVYRGPCQKGKFAYILAPGQNLQTVCPYMEVNYPFLLGYSMSKSDQRCRGTSSVATSSGQRVHAEVLHSVEQPGTIVIPWNHATRSFVQECTSSTGAPALHA